MPEQEDLRHLNDSGIGMELPAGALSIDFAFKVPKEALEQSYCAEQAAGETNIWVDEAGYVLHDITYRLTSYKGNCAFSVMMIRRNRATKAACTSTSTKSKIQATADLSTPMKN